MHRLLPLLLLLAAFPAGAAEGLYLTWNECALDASASHDRPDACDSNLGRQELFCAFRMPFPSDSVLGVEIVVDIQHSDTALPDWWALAPGGCRAGALQASFDFTTFSSCADFMFGNATGGVQGYYVGEPRGGANQARIKLAGAIPAASGYARLNATDLYYGAVITLTNEHTAGPGTTCAGCPEPACLVLNSILVRRQPGAPGGDIFLATPGPADDNRATWQGGAGADCLAVPARSASWGQVKGLYR